MTAPLAPPSFHRVEVIAPDPESAALLLQYVAPAFPAKLVTGSPLTVRLQPPQSEPRWVIEFLSLVERWLESVPLPCANVLYGGRGYLIRAPLNLERLVGPATVA
jgi:hypothetical protein